MIALTNAGIDIQLLYDNIYNSRTIRTAAETSGFIRHQKCVNISLNDRNKYLLTVGQWLSRHYQQRIAAHFVQPYSTVCVNIFLRTNPHESSRFLLLKLRACATFFFASKIKKKKKMESNFNEYISCRCSES